MSGYGTLIGHGVDAVAKNGSEMKTKHKKQNEFIFGCTREVEGCSTFAAQSTVYTLFQILCFVFIFHQ